MFKSTLFKLKCYFYPLICIYLVLGAFCLQKSPLLTSITAEVCFEGASQHGALAEPCGTSSSARGRWSLWWPSCGHLPGLCRASGFTSCPLSGDPGPAEHMPCVQLQGHHSLHWLLCWSWPWCWSCPSGDGCQLHSFLGGCGFSGSCTPILGPCYGHAGSGPCPSHQPAACSAGVLMAALLLTCTVVFGKSSIHFVTTF